MIPRAVLVRRYGCRECTVPDAALIDFYELTIDVRSQYGQRNADGDGRFVALHMSHTRCVGFIPRLTDVGLPVPL